MSEIGFLVPRIREYETLATGVEDRFGEMGLRGEIEEMRHFLEAENFEHLGKTLPSQIAQMRTARQVMAQMHTIFTSYDGKAIRNRYVEICGEQAIERAGLTRFIDSLAQFSSSAVSSPYDVTKAYEDHLRGGEGCPEGSPSKIRYQVIADFHLASEMLHRKAAEGGIESEMSMLHFAAAQIDRFVVALKKMEFEDHSMWPEGFFIYNYETFKKIAEMLKIQDLNVQLKALDLLIMIRLDEAQHWILGQEGFRALVDQIYRQVIIKNAQGSDGSSGNSTPQSTPPPTSASTPPVNPGPAAVSGSTKSALNVVDFDPMTDDANGKFGIYSSSSTSGHMLSLATQNTIRGFQVYYQYSPQRNLMGITMQFGGSNMSYRPAIRP